MHISRTRACGLVSIRNREQQPAQTSITASVIVPTYDRPRYLRDALASLLQHDLPSSSYEIIVVDNKPTGDVRKIVGEFA